MFVIKGPLIVLLFVFLVPSFAIDYIRAVSIGGHLVPEPFIQPDLWETINQFCPAAKDIWNICECTSQNPTSSSQVIPLLQNHLRSFINITDLESKIQITHINAIRYPISFTYFLDSSQDPSEYAKYNSCGVTKQGLDQSSFKNILVMAQKNNVRVILDLHQVQGCQNGFDNGGHAGVKEFYTAENVQKGINIWTNMINYLVQNQLLGFIWGFEVLNEPLPDSSSDHQFLQQFTENVINQVIQPKISPQQVVVLQPGPGNSLVSEYEQYNLPNLQYIFDFHEYIVFGSPLYLTTMGAILVQVQNVANNDYGASKWPYFVGEWSHATTDCAQYLNGAFGGFDPNYYSNQHASRNTFTCNNVTQDRDGFTVGFQTCSVILFGNEQPSYGYCSASPYPSVWNQYRGAVCKLFATYLSTFKQNSKNIGFAFWTFTTGSGVRRIQQWDYALAVDQGIVTDTINPTPVDQCDSIFLE